MFVHPWAIVAGGALVALPVIVHFLTRPRPVRLPLSTIRFVREVIQLRRARHRLRDFLVLALRTLAVALVALAIARPQPLKQPLVTDGQAGAAVRIVLVDASQSMAALDRGVTALERARTVAAGYLRYRPGLHANVIVAAARPAAVLTEPSQNFEALRAALAAVPVHKERFDVNRALALAAEMLTPTAPDDARRRELIVVSDFQRSNWAGADLTCLPAATRVQLQSVAADASANLALLRAELRGRAAVGGQAQLEVEVGNYGPAPRTATVEVTLGQATYRLEEVCPAGRRTVLVQEVPLREPGWQTGEARLIAAHDALDVDDTLGVVVQIHPRPRFALVTRQPVDQRPSSSHFLECGLVPDARPGAPGSADVTRMSPGKLNREALAAADLIAFDHPGRLTAEEVQWMAGLLRRGHPLLYVASELTDAANLTQLGAAAGTDLQLPVEFTLPPAGQPRQDLFLTSVRTNLAPFDVLGEDSGAVAGRLRFAGGLSSRRRENTLADDVLATYNDGTACLVRTSSGAGVLAVLNADLQQSTLAKTAAFVPLLDRLVQHLLEQGHASARYVCGEPLVVRLPGGTGTAEQLEVTGPVSAAATSTLGELTNDGPGVVWRCDAPAEPGVYQMQRDGQTVFALPIWLAEEESQLDSLPADVLEQRLAAGHEVQFRPTHAGREQQDVLWSWLLIAGVLCLLGEITALLAFRS